MRALRKSTGGGGAAVGGAGVFAGAGGAGVGAGAGGGGVRSPRGQVPSVPVGGEGLV